ncbi:MAG: type II secretion system protein [Actinomycetes bacterium]
MELGGHLQMFTTLVNALGWTRKLKIKEKVTRNTSGFTLIEIIVVISIMAVLGSIVVLSVKNVSISSREKACQADWRAINSAASAYFDDTGSEALTLGALVTGNYYKLPDGEVYVAQTSVAREGYSLAFASGVITVTAGDTPSSAIVGARSNTGELLPDACTLTIN